MELLDLASKLSPIKAREFLEMVDELKKRKTENLAKTLVPNVKAEEFIKMVGKNETFVNLFCAANGTGKSCTCVNIVTNICFGPQNDFFKYPLYENFPYLKRGRIISDPTTLKEKIVPELKKWFPSNRYNIKYETYKEGKSYESRWITDTGFEFDLMSSEQESKEFESVDLGWAYFDEPCPSRIYRATISRLRTGGIVFWGMTPLAYSVWVKDEIYDKRDGKMIDYVTASIWDNCVEYPKTRGILHKADIDRMISQYPEDEKLARIEGRFGHLLGLVHKTFEPKIHVIEPFDITEDDYVVYMALDTHPRVPDAYSWMAVDRKGRKFIIDEMAFTGTDEESAAKLQTKEATRRMGEPRLIDPSAFNEDKRTTEVSFAERMRRRGYDFAPGSKHMHEGIRRTDKAFRYEKLGSIFIKEPELYIFSNCVGHIRELQNYVWDEYQGRSRDQRDPKAKPKDINDHFVENIHRLLLEEFTFYEKSVKEEVFGNFDPYSIV